MLDRRAVLRAFMAAGAASLLAGCGDDEQAGVQDSEKGTASAVLRPISEKFGLAKDLNLRYVAGSGPGDVQNKLLSGALNVSSFGPLGAAVSAGAGADVVLFSPGLNNHVRWLVAANSPYRSPADLRGKSIATPPKNSDAYRSAQLAAGVNGIRFDEEYKIHQGAVLNGVALFERGDVEAIVTIEPNATRLVGQGARQIATVDELWRQGSGESAPLVLNGQGALRSWLDGHREIALRLARLRTDVHERIRAEPRLLAEFHAAYGFAATETRAIALLPERMAAVYPTEWDQATFANLKLQIDKAVELGILPAAPAKDIHMNLEASQ
ncbi:PhnD/SsuA/transferrin family substrate-binding protein [Nonomuraea sp. NPDC046802]|uniref:ABC transporter substrate-binding protein n=1 Tax=Nonomuraea sp. NPDC046802 TaxID=3154919 RepID=UPI0033CCA23E